MPHKDPAERARYLERWRVEARAIPPEDRTDIEHGKLSTYKNYGCRCMACKAANAARGRQERAEKRKAPQPKREGG